MYKLLLIAVISMASPEGDPLSQWCVNDDLSKSIWISNSDAYDLLMKDLAPVNDVLLEDVIENSEKFPVEFPIDTVRCTELKNYVSKENLERYVNSVYPIIHDKIFQLCAQFLLHKTSSAGSKTENEFYKNMDVASFIDRLLRKRAVMFMEARDNYMLLNGVRGSGNWETIGTEFEKVPLVLEQCLSYDEIKFSAFLSVTSYTHYLNLGNRTNEGVYFKDRKNIEDEGIIIGLIGPRFEKQNVMDYQDIIHDGIQKEMKNMFIDMYGENYVKYEDLIKRTADTTSRFTEYKPDTFFDNHIYSKRIALSFDTLLYEANLRAKERGTTAFIHVVGIGLGVWKVSSHQNKLFVDTCAERIAQLGMHLHSVSDVCFAYIRVPEAGKYKNGDVIPIEGHPKGGIKIHIMNRDPHQKLKGDDAGKLLVVSYAWDGNALPGNEFWIGSLSGSGDPAAASSTQVAELHNAHINPKVCGSNLRIVTCSGVLTLEEYQKKVKKLKDEI